MLVRKQGIDSPKRLRVLMVKNSNNICNVVRKPGGKNANGIHDRRQQVTVIAQENLKPAIILFHHRLRCTFDWEVMEVHEDAVHLLAGQKRLKDEYKDTDVLPKVNKVDMAGMMESIKEYFRSCYGVIRVPLTYIITKTITVQTYGDYLSMQLLMTRGLPGYYLQIGLVAC